MNRVPIFALGAVLSLSVVGADSAPKHYTTKNYHVVRSTGLVRTAESQAWIRKAKHTSFRGANVVIPGKADISAKVSLPEDQGQCGSCWDFSLTKALRSVFMTAGKDPGTLAFNYLLNNCGPGTKEQGCNGGDFPAADNFTNKAGPWLESQDPYTQAEGQCVNEPVAATVVSYTMLGKSGSGPTFEDLANAVGVQGHMVSIDVDAEDGDWMNYSTGVYDGCQGDSSGIDHMIDLVGYDCQTSVDASGNCAFDSSGKPVKGDGYLIVENNWGESWGTQAANGHGGYMFTRMYDSNGNKCNAVATDALIYTK